MANGKYKVSAIADDDGECDVYNDLMGNLPSQYTSLGDGLLDKIDRISNDGFDSFSSRIAHEINKNPKIYELIQGTKLRLVFFHGEKEMVAVCTEIIIKKTQKVDKGAVKRAINAYKTYWQSVNDGSLNIIEEEENGTE